MGMRESQISYLTFVLIQAVVGKKKNKSHGFTIVGTLALVTLWHYFSKHTEHHLFLRCLFSKLILYK